MIHSMTGFGSSRRVEGDLEYTLEIRSLNSRYFKLSVKLPEFLQFAEGEIERMVRSRLARGSVSYTLRVQGDVGATAAPIDLAVLQSHIDRLAQARVPEGMTVTLDLGFLATLPGVCQADGVSKEQRERFGTVLEELTSEALDALTGMRAEEGRVLRDELLGLCEEARGELSKIEAEAPNVLEEYHERLKSRVALLMERGGFELDADGLMREVAIFADRSDVNEEITRLSAHLDQFVTLCLKGDRVGRKLDFVAQELLREANTIASKTNNVSIARSVVEIKGTIDRLKEQVQNVE
jgi:uncharacterized protein (TIGR00255 family)